MIMCGLGMSAGLVLLVTANVTLRAPSDTSAKLAQRALPAELALQKASLATTLGQQSFLGAVAATTPLERVSATAAAEQQGQIQDASWATYLGHALGLPGERPLQLDVERAQASSRHAAASLIASNLSPAEHTASLSEEQQQSASEQGALSSLVALYRDEAVSQAGSIRSGIGTSLRAELALYGALGLLFTLVGLVLLRGARRDEHQMTREAGALRTAAERADLEGSLQRGLEMESTEEGAIAVIRQAVDIVAPDVPTELLLADSSRAHFRQVFSTGADGEAGCRATAPGQCPATTSGQTRTFETSGRLDTCPFLRDYAGQIRATCVPISVAGRTTGVLRSQQPVESPAPSALTANLELVARKAGERLGFLRVLARSEAQARVDPLTGLPNRRTLEDQVRELVNGDERFVVAFADLDHFKAINDHHGHDVGDRALRLFARVLRDSIRPRDLVARYGGEEFVVILPDCTVADARMVADRIRGLLAELLGQATVPPFTVTIGLSAADPGDPLADVIARADQAMLRGKTLGRNRVESAEDLARFQSEVVAPEADTAAPTGLPA